MKLLSVRFWCRSAAIAQWIRLRLSFCRPGFESQAHHLRFYHLQYLCYICRVKRTKINKNRHGSFSVYLGLNSNHFSLLSL